MDKEEIEYCGLKIVVNNETYAEYKGTLEEQIEQLQQENKKYKEVIDKAIEYIKEKQKIQYKFALSHIECDDLLQILEKGESNE